MKKIQDLYKFILIVILIVPVVATGQDITVSAMAKSGQIVSGEKITVPVTIDISNFPEKLGSYTAELSWDAGKLRFVGYQAGTGGFSEPVVNESKASEGQLNFAAANPHGATGKVNILNAEFEVIGPNKTSAPVELRFTAMASAYTFKDLLPYLGELSDITTAIQISDLPGKYDLQNYPNPFGDGTKITYSLPEASDVHLAIYNVTGQKIQILDDGFRHAGSYNKYWDGTNSSGMQVPEGIYLCTLQAGKYKSMIKLQLARK